MDCLRSVWVARLLSVSKREEGGDEVVLVVKYIIGGAPELVGVGADGEI